MLLASGETIAVEDPGYSPPRHLFNAPGLGVVGVPVDGEGLVVDTIPRGVRAIYAGRPNQTELAIIIVFDNDCVVPLDPSHQSPPTRKGHRHCERILMRGCDENLQSLDPTGRVVYVASFSKTMLPTLRVGFPVAPPSLHLALRKAKFGDAYAR